MQYEHLLKALGKDDVNKLSTKTVSIVGLGGIGSALAELLVRSGVAVRVIEKDRVLEEDLDRLSLFEHKHITKFKATEAKKVLNRINPEIQVKSFNEEVTEQSMFLINADVVCDCSGSSMSASDADVSITSLVSKYCFENKIPCIGGGIRDSKCIVATASSKLSIQDQLDTLSFSRGEGLLPAASTITAGFMYVKVLKILLGKKVNKNLLVYDMWKQEFVGEAPAKKPAKKVAKKAPAKKTAKKPVKKAAPKKKAVKKAPAKKKPAAKKKTTKKK